MESVVYKGSPLAEYLEGEGQGGFDWSPTHAADEPPSPPSPQFAPRGPSSVQAKFRRRLPQPPPLKIPKRGTVSRIHNACSSAVNARLGRVENARFLEQFRYIIVASQLLSAEINASHFAGSGNGYGNGTVQREVHPSAPSPSPPLATVNLTGAGATAAGAFAFVWILHWARGSQDAQATVGRVALAFVLLVSIASAIYAYVRRQWLQYLRHQAVLAASLFVAKSEVFDAAASAAINLIQEVEIVSRGYRISSPLPPISRMEERSQSRRCARLRRTLQASLAEALPPLLQACDAIRPLAVDVDLDRYYDIYELSVTDMQEAEVGFSETEFEDAETIRALKTLLHRLHILRKIFCCSLLALDADGGKADFSRWAEAVGEMQHLAAVLGEGEERLRNILAEEEQFAVPATPKSPVAPGRERIRLQLRKLGSLSQGIRGLQAKLHVLREESDKSLDGAEDAVELGSDMMAQYESIGKDLQMLMQEWESGKASLALNIDRNEKRVSQISNGLRSPTPSLGGATMVEGGGSPADAFRALNGESRARWSMDLSTSNSEDGEVFEAVASPRQRSSLTREERIAKMKENRAKVASSGREKASFANTNMLRELESVINLRPRGRTGAHTRITSM
ncbi:MAG: hypothetical protein M1832_001874 [Thelocarpon impressellum]|nr:MAG: hypothetical protein M1832_001874 [Thelocarpon impressellum]